MFVVIVRRRGHWEELMLTRRLRHRAEMICVTKKIIVVVSILCMGVFVGIWHNSLEEVLPVSGKASVGQEQYKLLEVPTWRDVLFSGVPQLVTATQKPMVIAEKSPSSPGQMMRDTILFLTNVDIKDMRSVFQAEIPVLATVQTVTSTVSAMTLPNFPKFELTNKELSGKPLVGLYYTHTAESFVPSSGVTHKPGGQRGDIVEVGGALAKKLNTYGIGAVQNTNIHDYPSFMKAYGVSELTVKSMLAENPSLQMIFDIHRDADKRANYVATVNGVQVARLMIIVTTGQPGLIQPHWQQNHAFAKLIDAKMNERYPGVSRGIRMDDFRYNEHLHPRLLLVEVGCQENTKEEAERGIELFGDIIAEIIAEGNKQ